MAKELKPALIDLAETNPGYYEYVGELHRMLGEWKEAEMYYRMALDSSPELADDPYAISALGLGFLSKLQGNQQESIDWLDRSLRAKSKFVDQGGKDKWVLADIAYNYGIREDVLAFLGWMQQAIDAGWQDVRYAARDPYLERLQLKQDVAALFDKVRQNLEKMRLNLSLEEDVILN